MNRLDLVAGPNGAGKSTFVERQLAKLLPGSVFVNADEIAKQRWPDDPSAHAYEAAIVAGQTRAKLIELGRPFIAETVFSHPSKLDLVDAAHGAGYTVVLHVLLIPEELAVQRVAYRVQAGGHPVAESKIRERYHRLWTLVADAIRRCDQATVYDNSANQRSAHRRPDDGWLHRRLPRLARLDTAAPSRTLAEVIGTSEKVQLAEANPPLKPTTNRARTEKTRPISRSTNRGSDWRGVPRSSWRKYGPDVRRRSRNSRLVLISAAGRHHVCRGEASSSRAASMPST